MTAFWVFYLSKDKLEQAKQTELYNINSNLLYSGLIDKDLKMEIDRANQHFLQELNDLKAAEMYKDLNREYHDRIK